MILITIKITYGRLSLPAPSVTFLHAFSLFPKALLWSFCTIVTSIINHCFSVLAGLTSTIAIITGPHDRVLRSFARLFIDANLHCYIQKMITLISVALLLYSGWGLALSEWKQWISSRSLDTFLYHKASLTGLHYLSAVHGGASLVGPRPTRAISVYRFVIFSSARGEPLISGTQSLLKQRRTS